ncbi:MAG: dihydroorotase [Ferruginibacter sp.]|nr:dihydroorotase [Ferruginibacter sp.]
MNVLLQQVTIICSTSAFNKQVKDILILNGTIKQIANNIAAENYVVVKGNNLHVSIGWMDIFSNFAEPGYEYREDFETGANAAMAGGFTDVMLIPNTKPIVDSKAKVEFVKQRFVKTALNIYPIGAITTDTNGNTLTEMYDMYNSGAIAFSDGIKSIQQSGILLKALQYTNAKNAVIIQIPNDISISEGGLMNEGIESTKLGLPGSPAIAEEIMIARDIELLSYSNSTLHITGVSTNKGLTLIKAAKQNGLKITCSVTPYHLFFSDKDLINYDTNLKVTPSLRTIEDVNALQAGLINGDIDCIASHHAPYSWDEKVCEFEYAKNGMITLQTMYGTINDILNDTEALVKLFTENNRNIFGIPTPLIEEGANACITIFEPDTEYIFEECMIVSKSKNSAFVGQKMKGKIVGIVNKGMMVLNK